MAEKKFSGFFQRAQLEQPSSTEEPSLISEKAKWIKTKLEAYIEEASTLASSSERTDVSPLAFWAAKKDTFREISRYALDILCVPASSAGIERVFPLASIVQGGRRFRLGAGSTEAELMIKVNRSFLTEEHV